MTNDQRIAEADRLLAQLSELFDAVQVLGTYLMETGDTRRYSKGSGNWYARAGMVAEFQRESDANELAHAIKAE